MLSATTRYGGMESQNSTFDPDLDDETWQTIPQNTFGSDLQPWHPFDGCSPVSLEASSLLGFFHMAPDFDACTGSSAGNPPHSLHSVVQMPTDAATQLGLNSFDNMAAMQPLVPLPYGQGIVLSDGSSSVHAR